MAKTKIYLLAILVFVYCTFALTGCSSSGAPTQANYDKVTIGMSYKEVVDLMGEPDKKQTPFNANVDVCQWEPTDKGFVITFDGQKVQSKHTY